MGHAWLSVLGRFCEYVADFHKQVCYQHASYIGMIVCGELCLIYYLTTDYLYTGFCIHICTVYVQDMVQRYGYVYVFAMKLIDY